MYNNIVHQIVLDTKKYKTKSQLVANINTTVNELRTELYDFLKRRYSDVELFPEVGIVEAVEEIRALPCTSIESDLELLNHLVNIIMVSIDHNAKNNNAPMLMLKTLLYICVVAVNQIYVVESQPPVVEGVTVIFYESKTKISR